MTLRTRSIDLSEKKLSGDSNYYDLSQKPSDKNRHMKGKNKRAYA